MYVDKVYLNPNKQRNDKLVKKIVIPIVIVLAILLIAFIISKIMLYRKIDSMWHNIGLAVEAMAEDMDEDGNNSYESALKMYNEFDSKSELSKEKVIEAKYFLNLFKFRDDYLNANNCRERYISACKIMTCLVGKKGFERLEDDGLTNKDLSSALHVIDDKYLDSYSKSALSDFKEKFVEEFASIKVEYQIYMLITDCEYLLSNEIKEEEIIENIMDGNIALYFFENTQLVDKYTLLKDTYNEAITDNIDLSIEIEESYEKTYKALFNKLYKIQAVAYEEKGNKELKANNYDDAMSAYNQAIKKYDKLGSAGENDKKRIENLKEGINDKISDIQASKDREKIANSIMNAVEFFNKGKYKEAQKLCSDIEDELSKTKITSGQEYEDWEKLNSRVASAVRAEGYKENAEEKEKQKDYKNAAGYYEKAEKEYKDAGLSSEENKMFEKRNEMNSKLEEQNQEKETDNRKGIKNEEFIK